MSLPLATGVAAILARDLEAFRRSLAAYPDDPSTDAERDAKARPFVDTW